MGRIIMNSGDNKKLDNIMVNKYNFGNEIKLADRIEQLSNLEPLYLLHTKSNKI